MGRNQTRKASKKKMSIPGRIAFIVAVAVFLVSAGMLVKHYVGDYSEQQDFSRLQVKGTHDLEALYKKNNDLVGWVKIKGTKVDYPVVQTPKDPEYYLRRNFEKENSISGTPFMDEYSKIGKSKNYLIYGHNIKSGTMFHQLLKFEKQDFFNEHPTFTYDEVIDGKQVNGKYQIIAAFPTQIYPNSSNSFKYYEYPSVTNETTFNIYVANCKRLSAVDTGVDAQWGDQLVTLSTCAYHVEDGRFVVVGKKVR